MRSAAAVLWASAFIVAALILVVAGRLPESPAYAEMATSGNGGFTMVTAPSGFGSGEILYVIDNQAEVLYIYGVDNAADRRINLRGGAFLPTLFRAGRGG